MLNMKFKNSDVMKRAFVAPWDEMLVSLYEWVITFCNEGKKVITTSTFRKGDKGCHGTIPLRAFDLRSWNLLDPSRIPLDVNEHWIYDPKRPNKKVAILHAICPECKHNNLEYRDTCEKCGAGLPGWHLHLQVHKNTEFIDAEKQKIVIKEEKEKKRVS